MEDQEPRRCRNQGSREDGELRVRQHLWSGKGQGRDEQAHREPDPGDGCGPTDMCPGHSLRQSTGREPRSEEHTSELQSLMRISYAVFCLKKKQHTYNR